MQQRGRSSRRRKDDKRGQHPFFYLKDASMILHNKYKERGRGGEKGGKGSKHASVQRRWSERERDRERELWEQAVRQSSAGEGGKCERECV